MSDREAVSEVVERVVPVIILDSQLQDVSDKSESHTQHQHISHPLTHSHNSYIIMYMYVLHLMKQVKLATVIQKYN